MNFLYAMVGALENKHWGTIAKEEKGSLLFELAGYKELEKILQEEGIEMKNNKVNPADAFLLSSFRHGLFIALDAWNPHE